MAATVGLASALSERRQLENVRGFLLIAFAVAMAAATSAVIAATFGPVRYDPNGDQLIVTMIYDGTHPNHHFTIHWDTCRKVELVGQPEHVTGVNILDDDYNDAANKPYTETIKMPLANLSCRPATVWLWTPPSSTTSVDIPARP